ncbi:MAG: glycosyltransferase family 4 protein, partial [Anaerolineae bacterium]
LALRLARLLVHIPFSVVFHFPPSQVAHRYREFKRWHFNRDAQHLVAVSHATANEVEAWSGRSCLVIGHGVDTERFRPDSGLRVTTRQELGIGADDPILISVAALEERKGMQWVIRALPFLLKQIPDLYYVIVGAGPYLPNLASLVSEHGLEAHVHLLGSKLDVRPYLCAADVMMVLAKGEASSISLLEALACGLPAVTSLHPPFDELIQDEFGERVDETQPHQVAAAVTGLLGDQGKHIRMGAAGRARMTAHHSWVVAAECYRDLIGQP